VKREVLRSVAARATWSSTAIVKATCVGTLGSALGVAEEPDEIARVSSGNRRQVEIMIKQSMLVAAAALIVGYGEASAQNQPSQDTMRAPTGFESTAPNNPPAAIVPEAATDSPRAPASQTTGQAPNVSRKMGAEMDSPGDKKASPDGE
jgi:hypothetical protein